MEMMDVVDKEDSVISTVPKSEIYEKSLTHRIVHVLVFNNEGKMAIQLRSVSVSFCPAHWSTTAGGHVQAGETYEQAALREYQEELGVTSTIRFFSKDFYIAKGTPPKFIVAFKTVFNGPFHPDPADVEKVCFFTIAEIKKMTAGAEKFHPELLFLLKKYFF